MTSEWDGTAWQGSPPPGAALIELPAKAATGPGVGFFGPGSMTLTDFTRSPQQLMLRAQQAYRSNPWIRLAESTVTRKVAGLPWHFENDQQDELVAGEEPPAVVAIRNILTRPIIGGRTVSWYDFESLLSRHLGLCGMGYVYLDQVEATAGTPLALVYVNPARVWPSEDKQGNLMGWVLDAQDQAGHGGTPYSVDELIPFYLEQPDFGHLGFGMYEAAMLKAQIATLGDQHAAYVFGTGGRIAGIVAPKDGIIPDEKFLALVREFRVVNEAPDAAKRTTVMQGPTDFIKTAADPSELNLVELSKLTRDDILAIWGVPGSQAGVAAPAGLNSGGTKEWDEAVLMQGAVHDRVLSIRETLQARILDRWQGLGTTVTLVIDEPEYDDMTPAFDRAEKARFLPLTRNERRSLVNEDPLPDYDTNGLALGVAIDLPTGLATDIAEGPNEHGKLAAREVKPPPPPPIIAPPPPAQGANLPPAAKARLKPLLGLRQSIEQRWIPRIEHAVGEALAEQRAAVAAKLRDTSTETWRRKRNDPHHWFGAGEDRRLLAVLLPQESAIADTVTDRVAVVLRKGKAGFAAGVVRHIARRLGERIKAINEATREAIAVAITTGFEQGLSPLEVAILIEASTAFDSARAERIARTESMFAYNDAALGTYTEYGVTEVQAIDGDHDPECAERDGQVFSIEDAAAIEDHPNGTLDWVPYFADEKARTTTDIERLLIALAAKGEPVTVNVETPTTKRYHLERDANGDLTDVTESVV